MSHEPEVSNRVDRAARDRMIDATERFLSSEIGSYEFDFRIFDIAGRTRDETVSRVARLLWLHYSDFTDHKAALSKGEWDEVQRVVLILRSDAALVTDHTYQWSAGQLIALAALVAGAVGLWSVGFGPQLLFVVIPMGVVSLALSRCQESRTELWRNGAAIGLAPFASMDELRRVYRSVPGMRKQRFPDAARDAANGRAIGRVRMTLDRLADRVAWVLFGPGVLFAQVLPSVRETSRVVLE